MDIPFKLTFFINDFEGELFNKFANTLEDALEDIENYCFSCKELHDIRVKFESNEEDIDLWIEVMDMLPLKSFLDLEVELQRFLPSEETRGIYLNKKSKYNVQELDYSYLLPGVYRIIVTVDKTIKYFAFLKVEPLRINEEQLILMREEVESTLDGLAKEIATKRSLMGQKDNRHKNDLLQRYHFIIANADTFITNLNLILKEPKYKIVKNYISKSIGQPIRSDLKTTKLMQSKFTQTHRIPSYNYEINYNISINNNLKKMIEDILKSVLELENYIKENIQLLINELSIQIKYKSPIDEIERKINILNEQIVKVNQLKANLKFALRKEWILKIESSMKSQDRLPRIPYYRTIYTLYQQLNKDKLISTNPFEYYIYYWKETSKLYEIWGFLKILSMLKESKVLKLNDISGWIFENIDNSKYPLLAPDTKITLTNSEGLKLVVFYDSFIPKPNQEIDSIHNPLISVENSNRPDFRLDIYYQEFFKGSILADFKYRNLGKLGNEDVYINNKYSDQGYNVYSQLIDYSYTRSFYLNTKDKSNFSHFAIKRVFGIFPRKSTESISFISDPVTNIIRCSLSPGMELNKVENEFIEIIEDSIKR